MSTEAATIDPADTATKTATQAATPHGRVSFKAAMEQASKEAAAENPQPTPVEPKAEPVAKEAPVKETPKEQPKETAKPRNALDALLSGKPAETKQEAAPEDPAKDLDKETNLAKLRKKAEDGWARARELEAKVGTPDPKLTGELDTLRKTLSEREAALQEHEAKLAEYKDAMVAVNIELDPDYRREFIDGRKALVATAAAKLKTYGGDENALAEALAMPEGLRRDEAIEAVLPDGINSTARDKIMRAVSEVEALDEKRAAVLKNSEASFEELQRRHAAQAKAAAEEAKAAAEDAEIAKKATFDRVARELATSVVTLSMADETLDGGKDWNAARIANNTAAMSLLSNDTTPEQIVSAAIKAADYDRLAGLFMETRKALAERDARLAEFEGAQPDTKGRKTATPTKEEQLAKLTPGQRFMQVIGSQKNEDF